MENTEAFRNQLDPKSEIGMVRLGVKDLAKMSLFYQDVIGLSVIDQGKGHTDLGVSGLPLVGLVSKPEGVSSPYSTGLYHLAILLPDRFELGRWLLNFLENGYRLDGAGDHLVSEALYLSDPDGNGIEVYRDRPRQDWEINNGQIKMDTLPVDIQSMLQEAPRDGFNGLPVGTKMGHVHLQVNDVSSVSAFYQQILGFDLVAQLPGAGFLSVGGYHHHIGMNTWRSYGGGAAPKNALGLIDYEVRLPNKDALNPLVNRLSQHKVAFEQHNGNLRVQDPAGIWINFGCRS
jgi:catechol 2,3-dioxygenase